MFTPSKRSIIVHVGTGKTGTTAIQQFLATNSSFLDDHGFRYATSGLADYNHHSLCAAYLYQPDAFTTIKSTYRTLSNELHEHPHHFILSSEYFLGSKPSDFNDLKEFLQHFGELHAVVYFRRQDTYVESWFNQVVKSGEFDRDIYQLYEELRRGGFLEYQSQAQLLTHLCDPAHIHVRSFDAAKRSSGRVVGDFLSFLGIAKSTKEDSCPLSMHANVSFSSRSTKLLQLIYERLGRESVEYFMQRQPGWFPLPGTSLVFTPAERAMIVHAHAESNREFTRKFCPEVNEFFDPLTIADWEESADKTVDKSLEDFFTMAVNHIQN